MMSTPAGVMATPSLRPNKAAVPHPFAYEAVAPTPARVVTTPAVETMRIAPSSATTRLPAASKTTPRGVVKVALAAGPSA